MHEEIVQIKAIFYHPVSLWGHYSLLTLPLPCFPPLSSSQRLTQRVSLSKCARAPHGDDDRDRDGLWKMVLHNRRQSATWLWWGTLKKKETGLRGGIQSRVLEHAERGCRVD